MKQSPDLWHSQTCQADNCERPQKVAKILSHSGRSQWQQETQTISWWPDCCSISHWIFVFYRLLNCEFHYYWCTTKMYEWTRSNARDFASNKSECKTWIKWSKAVRDDITYVQVGRDRIQDLIREVSSSINCLNGGRIPTYLVSLDLEKQILPSATPTVIRPTQVTPNSTSFQAWTYVRQKIFTGSVRAIHSLETWIDTSVASEMTLQDRNAKALCPQRQRRLRWK